MKFVLERLKELIEIVAGLAAIYISISEFRREKRKAVHHTDRSSKNRKPRR